MALSLAISLKMPDLQEILAFAIVALTLLYADYVPSNRAIKRTQSIQRSQSQSHPG